MQGEKLRIIAAMSGGVDSSVSAALLKEAGHEVTGVFIKVWQPPAEWGIPCTAEEDRLEAMRAAAHLGIPFATVDFGDVYKKEVVEYMVSEYEAGRTPNPDVMCNRSVKFGALWQWASEHGFDAIATGHYAQIKNGSELHAGGDAAKDQSYFLWTLTKDDLTHTLFPVGGMQKSEVRVLAEKFGLPNARRKDSQGLCFIGKLDVKEFLTRFISVSEGNILNEKGEVIGTHDGAVLYTLGERHGLRINAQSPEETPYYVVAKDVANNTLTVSHTPVNSLKGAHDHASLTEVNWIGDPTQEGQMYGARLRYRQPLQECTIQGSTVHFKKPQTVIPSGQSLVLYDGTRLVGGGRIQ